MNKATTNPVISDLVGMKFGTLTVTKVGTKRNWFCHCACGADLLVPYWKLVKGTAESCGCAGGNPWTPRKEERAPKFGDRI
jgi:hypothetical protein